MAGEPLPAQMAPQKDGFPKFPCLPYELRCLVWGEAMPAPSIFMVACQAALKIDDRTDGQDSTKTLHLVLCPSQHHFKIPGFKQRARAQKTLLATCLESRQEFHKHFPDTLGAHGQRFIFRHDLIYIAYEFLGHMIAQCGLVLPRVCLKFHGGWNTRVHRLALNCDMWDLWFGLGASRSRGPRDWQYSRLEGFMEFLTTCTSLRQLVVTREDGLGSNRWVDAVMDHCLEGFLRYGTTTALNQGFADCYRGLICAAREQYAEESCNPADVALFLRQVINDDPNFANLWGWMDKIKRGYPALLDLEISKMVHTSPDIRWPCKEF